MIEQTRGELNKVLPKVILGFLMINHSIINRATFFFCFFDSYANRATEQHGQQITVLQQGFSFVRLTSTKRVNWRQMSVWLAFTP